MPGGKPWRPPKVRVREAGPEVAADGLDVERSLSEDRNAVKRAGVERLRVLIAPHAQWLRIRYAF
jgi:hypothetical protein